jgi:uncharacterized damage-inducible protein DinB
MTMRFRMMAVAAALGCCSLGAVAQMSGMAMPAAPPVGSAVTPAKALDTMLMDFEMQLMGVVKAMPADKFNFAPSAGTFAAGSEAKFTGVRTFAQEATHLASANYYFYSVVSGMKPDVDMKTLNALTKKEDIVAALEKSFAFAHKAVATITPENAFVAIKPVDGMETRATLAAFGVAHGNDHYGQLVEYLRMNGVLPPGSK